MRKHPLKIVGIRGAFDTEGEANSFANYDDQFLVFLNGKCVSKWRSSTDPSWYFVASPIVRDSTGELHTGQLCPGVHLFGQHVLHGKYPCFGQAEEVHVYRLNTDGSVHHIEYGDFAVCIHSGGAGMKTNRFSLACQILQNQDGYFGNPTWNSFYDPLHKALAKSGKPVFPYFLVNAADVADAKAAPLPVSQLPSILHATGDAGEAPPPATHPPIVVPIASTVHDLQSSLLASGTVLADIVAGRMNGLRRVSPSVLTPGIERVQDALEQLGYAIDLGPGRINRGFFGGRTEEKLRAFQHSVPGLVPNGLVTHDTLVALDRALPASQMAAVALRSLPDRAAVAPGVARPRSDGYLPPPKSRPLLAGIDFTTAISIGEKYLKKFAAADKSICPRDPSLCRTLLQFSNGAIYFDSKMAIDTDGSPRAKEIDQNPHDASYSTSWTYPGTKDAFDSEKIPYMVLPTREKGEDSSFLKDTGMSLGNVAVVIYGDKMAGAIFADAGPSMKIGEGSIKLHEMLGQKPWDKHHEKVIDASIENNVLFFVFNKSIGEGLTPGNAVERIQEAAKACYKEIGGTWKA